VHPIGNFDKDKAEFGGSPGKLVPAEPWLMSAALRELAELAKAGELEYEVSFEATHHGPYLETPAFYIEIGSDEDAWEDEEAGETIARTILSVSEMTSGTRPYPATIDVHEPVAVGVGGGHYAPRITEVCIKKQLSFGHIIPSYIIDACTSGEEAQKAPPEDLARMLRMLLNATPGASSVYFHRKALKKSVYTQLKEWFEKNGIQAVRSGELASR
jgi:D-aminoacyl-tRNA deacylase